jgi:hypothetical protein
MAQRHKGAMAQRYNGTKAQWNKGEEIDHLEFYLKK